MTNNRALESAAQGLIAAAHKGRPLLPVLKSRCPVVYRQIKTDGKQRAMLSLWGRSLNVDEIVGQTIVHPEILRAIGVLAGVRMNGRVIHAGLQHTYGYLFSLIDTPYGAKRERWTSDDLERGLGLERSLLGDKPRAGTLLANVTWLLAHIVFRNQPRRLKALESSCRGISAPALVGYDYAELSVCRVVERAVLPGPARRTVALITDLVAFPIRPAASTAADTLLVYSVQGGAQARLRLITAFPVQPGTARAIKDSAMKSGQVSIRPRYNAYVPGFKGESILGKRYLASWEFQN